MHKLLLSDMKYHQSITMLRRVSCAPSQCHVMLSVHDLSMTRRVETYLVFATLICRCPGAGLPAFSGHLVKNTILLCKLRDGQLQQAIKVWPHCGFELTTSPAEQLRNSQVKLTSAKFSYCSAIEFLSSMISEYKTRNHRNLQIPKVRLECAKRGFYFLGVRNWNDILGKIREQDHLLVSKRDLESTFRTCKTQTRPLG